jgi:hypothetical protein
MALNENTTLQILSRWDKATGITRIVRVKKGEVWVSSMAGKLIEIETSTGTATVQSAEVDFRVAEDGQSLLSVIRVRWVHRHPVDLNLGSARSRL